MNAENRGGGDEVFESLAELFRLVSNRERYGTLEAEIKNHKIVRVFFTRKERVWKASDAGKAVGGASTPGFESREKAL